SSRGCVRTVRGGWSSSACSPAAGHGAMIRGTRHPQRKMIACAAVLKRIAWSEEFVGDVGFRQLTKCVVQGDFRDVEGIKLSSYRARVAARYRVNHSAEIE